MHSCIFEGRVRHTRHLPVAHRFAYRMFMLYLDLDELPSVFSSRWLWSVSRRAPCRFRRSDHLGPASEALDVCVRRLVSRRTGLELRGPIRLLTHLSYFGYCFNPVSFYYCYAADGRTLEAIVAEVNNTPWGEQHCYVMAHAARVRDTGAWRFQPHKEMHVSPFMPMAVDYDWTFTEPGARLTAFMAVARDGERLFDASLSLARTEITGAALARLLVAYPMMTCKVTAAIHWQALRLWLKRCPTYAHPRKRAHLYPEER